MSALLLVVGFLTLYPVVMLFAGSFKTGSEIGPGKYVEIFASIGTLKVLWTTVWLAAVRAILATAVAIFLAWVVARTNTPGRNIFEFLAWLAFFIPVLPRVLAWMALGLPKTGLINAAAAELLHTEVPLFNVQSYGGIIWVSVLSYSSVLFLLITPAFRSMDSSLEEASRTSGASGRNTFFRVTLPLLTPAIIGVSMLAFVRMMESFEIELLLGYPARIFVFTTQIYDYLYATPASYDLALALSTVFVVITFVLMLYQWRLLVRRERYAVVTGRGFAVRPLDLGRFKYVTAGLAGVYLALATAVPLAGLIMASLMKVPGLIGVPEPFTFSHYAGLLSDELLLDAVKNTLIIGVSAATIGILFYLIVSWVVVRSRFAGRSALDFFSWLPYTVPALVLGLGFLWAFVGGVRLPYMPYGSLQLMVLVFLVRGLPLGVRVMNGTVIQLGPELEESSRVHGGSWFYTLRRIVIPLLRPALLSTWILLLVIVFSDLATIIFLYGPDSRVLSVLLLEYWNSGKGGTAMVLGVLTTGIVVLAALGSRLFATKQGSPQG